MYISSIMINSLTKKRSKKEVTFEKLEPSGLDWLIIVIIIFQDYTILFFVMYIHWDSAMLDNTIKTKKTVEKVQGDYYGWSEVQ